MNRIRACALTCALTLTAFASAQADCPCPGDLNADGRTDFDDFAQLSACWGQPCGDLTGDATTDFADFSALSANWDCGPCLFEYNNRPNSEAEQITLELLGEAGPLLAPDDLYNRVERDLTLIRAATPDLAGETHSPAWSPASLIVKLIPGEDLTAYNATNAFYQASPSNLFGDWYVLALPGNVNIPALAAEYVSLAAIQYAEPDYLIGGANFWTPLPTTPDGVWTWQVDDGFWDCFDGCDCHYYYDFTVTGAGDVTLDNLQQVGQSWCPWDR